MKQGHFARIPECPDDLQTLWDQGQALDCACLPDWLDAQTARHYRRVGVVSQFIAAAAVSSQFVWQAELAELERCGLILEPAAAKDSTHHQLYMRQLQKSQVWSIGLYELTSDATSSRQPQAMTAGPAAGVVNPILTRDHVTDVPAAFVADPFAIYVQSLWHLFFEVLNWRTGKGEIGWATSSDGRTWTYRQIVLAEPFHLSYPLVFPWQGEMYLLPECHAAGQLRLYRAKRFPTEWELAATLLPKGVYQDPTLVRYQNRWWLFAETSSGIEHDTLRLFFCDDLFGPWLEHPASPLRTADPRRSRPAGRVIAQGSHLLRFAQDCRDDYGAAVHAHVVTRLTPLEYRETELSDVPLLSAGNQAWNAGGMHHLEALAIESSAGRQLVVVDGWHWGNCGW